MSVRRRRRSVISSVAAVTLPTTGLVGRYEANSAANFTVTGALIDQWNDLSGNGNHLTATLTERPTYDSALGYGRVVFGGSQNFVLPATVSLNRQACSMYAITRGLRSTTGTLVALGATPDLGMYFDATGQIAIRHSGAAATGIYAGLNSPSLNTIWMTGDAANAYGGHSQQTYTRGSALTAGTYTGAYVGRWSVASPFRLQNQSEIVALFIYSTAHDATTREQVLDYCTATYKSLPRTATRTAIFVQGDSLSAGVQATNSFDYSWPAQIARQHSYHPYMTNNSQGGRQINGNTLATPEVLWLGQIAAGSYTNRVVIVLLGTNDISAGRTPAQIQTDLTTYATNIRTADAGAKIVGMTLIAREPFSPAQDADIATLNAWIRSSGGVFDHVVDLAAQPEFDVGSATDLTYYDADGIHLNNNGYSVMAGYIRTVLVNAGYI